MSRRTVHHASGRHRPGHAILPLHARAHPIPPPEEDEAWATLDASADESVDTEFQYYSGGMAGGTVRGRGAHQDSWEGDEDRAEVDRFLRDHFARDELELA